MGPHFLLKALHFITAFVIEFVADSKITYFPRSPLYWFVFVVVVDHILISLLLQAYVLYAHVVHH